MTIEINSILHIKKLKGGEGLLAFEIVQSSILNILIAAFFFITYS